MSKNSELIKSGGGYFYVSLQRQQRLEKKKTRGKERGKWEVKLNIKR